MHGAILDHIYWTSDEKQILTDVISCHWSDHNIAAVTVGADQSASTHCEQNAPSRYARLTTSVLDHMFSHKTQVVMSSEFVLFWMQHSDHIVCNWTLMSQSKTSFISTRLKVCSVRGDGHCLLYSWAAATANTLQQVKRLLLNEYHANAQTYSNAGIDANELRRYVSSRSYRLDAVAAVLDILSNASFVRYDTMLPVSIQWFALILPMTRFCLRYLCRYSGLH